MSVATGDPPLCTDGQKKVGDREQKKRDSGRHLERMLMIAGEEEGSEAWLDHFVHWMNVSSIHVHEEARQEVGSPLIIPSLLLFDGDSQ